MYVKTLSQERVFCLNRPANFRCSFSLFVRQYHQVHTEQQSYLDMQLNRRQLLFYFSVVLLFLSSFGKKLITPLSEQLKTERNSRIAGDTFIENHREQLQQIEFGTTLCPVFLRELLPEATPEQAVQLLKTLRIRQVRFSMRWDHCVDAAGQIDLSYYLPWLQALIQADMQITLSCGPIKSPRYPESYVPAAVLAAVTQPTTPQGREQRITAQSPLAAYALTYLDQLLTVLNRELGSGMQNIVMFNPENESRNPFGNGKYLMEISYLTQVCQIIIKHKSDAAFLFNSAGVSQEAASGLEQTARLALYLRTLFPQNSFTVGMDSYEEQDFFKFPYYNFFPDTISALYILYPNSLIERTLAELAENEVAFEATELQFERWVTLLRDNPPGTLHHLQFMLLRYINTFLRDDRQLVRLWGFEQFMKKYSLDPSDTELTKLIAFITKVNNQTEEPL
jgi:hypothetical protein